MKKYLQITFALCLAFISLFFYSNINGKKLLTQKQFKIEKQESFLSIASRLQKEEVIRDANIFAAYAFLKAEHRSMKPGDYVFDGSFSIIDVLNTLKNHKGVSVTIPEGYNIYQIEKLLLDSEIILKKGDIVSRSVASLSGDFLKYDFLKNIDQSNNLEGFLYPNTYYFLKNTSPEEVLKVFLDNFDKHIYQPLKNKINEEDFYSKLIKVSLLEKEIFHKEDLPLALSVINNRLSSNMRLQIDATLCYAKNMLQYERDENLLCNKVLSSDKNIQSEYNTYRNGGLVKTPIANVNFDTFGSILEKVTSDYFYYITVPVSNDTVFAKTLDEHNRNIQKYLK